MNSDIPNSNEWLEYATADLESARLLLKDTKNYHIVVYHCHQVVEKMFKRFLILNNKKFPFVHELVELLKLVSEIRDLTSYLEDISLIMDLYINTRYPQGDKITKDDAQQSLKIAEEIYNKLID